MLSVAGVYGVLLRIPSDRAHFQHSERRLWRASPDLLHSGRYSALQTEALAGRGVQSAVERSGLLSVQCSHLPGIKVRNCKALQSSFAREPEEETEKRDCFETGDSARLSKKLISNSQ